MDCPKCGGEMYEEEVLTGRTTQADIEDSFSKVWVCEDCSHEFDPEENEE